MGDDDAESDPRISDGATSGDADLSNDDDGAGGAAAAASVASVIKLMVVDGGGGTWGIEVFARGASLFPESIFTKSVRLK